jgi:hypothetical protein
VAKVVEPHPGQTCALQERVEGAVEEVGLVQRTAGGVGKDQAVVLFGSRVSALGGLAEPVVGKGIDGDARKQNLPPRRLGLAGGRPRPPAQESAPSTTLGHLPNDGDDALDGGGQQRRHRGVHSRMACARLAGWSRGRRV